MTTPEASVENPVTNSPEVLLEFVDMFEGRLKIALDRYVGSRDGSPEVKRNAAVELSGALGEFWPKLFEAQKLALGTEHNESTSRFIPGYEHAQSLRSALEKNSDSLSTYEQAVSWIDFMHGVRRTLAYLKPVEK